MKKIMCQLITIIKLVRPAQWVKNLFVFLPVFFSGGFFNYTNWVWGGLAFAAMCSAASSIYCLNDVLDIEQNRQHPTKRFRPVAAGAISKNMALLISLILMLGALFAASEIPVPVNAEIPLCPILVGAYILINIAYCLFLKHIAILDIMCISSGFVIRLFVGGVACGIWISPWIVCLTFLLTMFLALSKRREELVLFKQSGIEARSNIQSYNLKFLDLSVGLLGAVTIVCYILYTVQPEVEARFHSQYVYTTAIFVVAGILRYLQLTLSDNPKSDPTETFYRDRFIQLCILLWGLSFIFFIYLP